MSQSIPIFSVSQERIEYLSPSGHYGTVDRTSYFNHGFLFQEKQVDVISIFLSIICRFNLFDVGLYHTTPYQLQRTFSALIGSKPPPFSYVFFAQLSGARLARLTVLTDTPCSSLVVSFTYFFPSVIQH